MTVLVATDVPVHYGYLFLARAGRLPRLSDTQAGQRNGLCGANVPGVLAMMTGLHTGRVPVTVEWHAAAPPVGDEWEEVVEVPYEPPGAELFLSSFQHGFEVHLPAAGSLRARYCAAGMDAGKATDTLFDEQPTVDRYLLALWPAAPEPERIVRQTSELAGYWHRHAQATPPRRVAPIEPPAGLRPPPIELRKAMHRGEPRDDALVAGWSADTRRAAARWLARRAFEMAGIDRLDWVRPALAALDRGEPLPAPFTSPAAVFPLLPPGDAGGTEPIHRPSFAVPAIFSAGLPDPRQALAETLRHAEATYHDRREELRRELLERYP